MPVSRKFLTRLGHAADPDNDPPALAGLDDVDWKAVEHAHGRATDIPVLLRAAASNEPDAREEAFQLLYESIWHQGSVYDATPLVIPFLFRLLEADKTPDRSQVAHLLATIAGNGYPEDDEEVVTCRRIIGQRLDLLFPYLRDKDWGVRHIVATAIGCYPEVCVRALPRLEAIYRKERNEAVRLALASAIGNSPEGAARVLPELEAALQAAPNQWVRQAYQQVIDRIRRGHA
jgi:hypothetical protein